MSIVRSEEEARIKGVQVYTVVRKPVAGLHGVLSVSQSRTPWSSEG